MIIARATSSTTTNGSSPLLTQRATLKKANARLKPSNKMKGNSHACAIKYAENTLR